jgi:putative restriction endonuclease
LILFASFTFPTNAHGWSVLAAEKQHTHRSRVPVMNKDSADFWLGKITRLRVAHAKTADSAKGPAPHKPLLLLSIIDLAESGKLPGRVLTRTPELTLRFREFGTLVADRWPTRLDIRLPFYHLKTQGFWHAYTAGMAPAQSDRNCMVIELDEDFFRFLADRDFRMKARLVLISRYFDDVEKTALFELLGLVSTIRTHNPDKVLAKALADGKRKGRSARFQIRVVDDYFHTCALTGYRCFTTDGASIVDAAHIESWAETQNDDITNGLALSKNAHWMFDAGLWAIDDDLRVIVRTHRFSEVGPEAQQLRSYAGRHLQFDPKARLRPSLESLRKHRNRPTGIS